jgi:hypothetical protein
VRGRRQRFFEDVGAEPHIGLRPRAGAAGGTAGGRVRLLLPKAYPQEPPLAQLELEDGRRGGMSPTYPLR